MGLVSAPTQSASTTVSMCWRLRSVWGGSRNLSIVLTDTCAFTYRYIHTLDLNPCQGHGWGPCIMHEGSLISCYMAREGGLVLLGLHVGPLVPWVSIGPWSWALGVPSAPWCPPGPCPWPFGLGPGPGLRLCWCRFFGLAQGAAQQYAACKPTSCVSMLLL